MTPRFGPRQNELGGLVAAPSGPAPRERDHGRFMFRPVVECSRIKIGAVRPHERMYFRVERDGVEAVEIAQRAVEVTLEHRSEVDRADYTVVERDAKPVRSLNLERFHSIDGVSHIAHLVKRLDPAWRPTRLEPIPGSEQLRLMDLSPCLHKAALSLTKATANELDGIDREDADVILMISVEVGSVMWPCGLGEHTDDDAKEPGNLWHPGLGLPDTGALSFTKPYDLSHSENFTLAVFSRSTNAFGYVGADDHALAWRTTRRMQVNS